MLVSRRTGQEEVYPERRAAGRGRSARLLADDVRAAWRVRLVRGGVKAPTQQQVDNEASSTLAGQVGTSQRDNA